MTVQVILTAGEFPYSVNLTIKVGLVTDVQYDLSLVKARNVLRSLELSGHEIDYKGSDKFIRRMVVGE